MMTSSLFLYVSLKRSEKMHKILIDKNRNIKKVHILLKSKHC